MIALEQTQTYKGQTSSRPLLHHAGEGGTQTVTEERNLSRRLVRGYEEGEGGTHGRRLGQTETSEHPCGSVRIKNSLARPTVRRKKAKGTEKNGTTVCAGPNRRSRSPEGKSVTCIPPVFQEGAETSSERERKKGTQTSCEHFHRSLRERENGDGKRIQETRDRKVRRQGG